ncbi:hypothetical protein RRG08_066774 [Elysia crispata]|uniref:Uncharacterized protein n=1 Tax=Elysia crispata TaxID=231223 RepID=A0AAE0XQ27_9GAST|nr:hypothetical protein RRG08_066774 [Elysia crispata]
MQQIYRTSCDAFSTSLPFGEPTVQTPQQDARKTCPESTLFTGVCAGVHGAETPRPKHSAALLAASCSRWSISGVPLGEQPAPAAEIGVHVYPAGEASHR